MSNKIWKFGFYAILLLGLFGSKNLKVYGGEVQNLLLNGGFEEKSEKEEMPGYWEFRNMGGSNAIGVWDNSMFHSGKRSVKIENLNRSGYSAWITSCKVRPKTTYRISLWYKTSGYHSSSLVVIYLRNANKRVTESQIFSLGGSEKWKFFEKNFNTDIDTSSLLIELRGQREEKVVWYDDISLIEIGPARVRPVSLQKNLIRITPERAERLMREAIYIAEEGEFVIISPKGKPKIVEDNSARGGKCARIFGDDPPYFQIKWEWEKKIPLGFTYTLYGSIKVKKIGDEGTAFRVGVFDRKEQKYVAKDMRPLAKDTGNMRWETYQIGTFALEESQTVYVGPTRNKENISEIFVDYFFFVPGDGSCRRFWKDEEKYKPTTKFYLRGGTKCAIGLRIKENKIKLGYLISRDKRKREKTFIGIIIDYHTESGYTKRELLSLGLCGNKIIHGENLVLGYGKDSIDEVIKLSSEETLGVYQHASVDFEKYAPKNWDGEVWLSFVNLQSLATFTGMVMEPKRDKMEIFGYRMTKKEDEVVILDKKSADFFSQKIKENQRRRLKSFWE